MLRDATATSIGSVRMDSEAAAREELDKTAKALGLSVSRLAACPSGYDCPRR